MNRSETIAIMGVLRVAYPRYYAGANREELESTVNLWAEMFASDPAQEVSAAVKAFIATDEKGFPPHIGAIKAQISKMHTANMPDEQEAWGMVLNALRNSMYGYAEEFSRLPAEVRQAVGNARQLQTWAAMDAETVNSVVASNFQRSYRAKVAGARENYALPEDIRQFRAQIADTLFKQLPEG
jgi:hypothetical protein